MFIMAASKHSLIISKETDTNALNKSGNPDTVCIRTGKQKRYVGAIHELPLLDPTSSAE